MRQSPQGVRNPTIDGMRVVAAASVVMIHVCAVYLQAAGPDFSVRLVDSLANWGLPFFFCVSGYLHARSRSAAESPGSWRKTRLVRLGLPYAAWSVVYLAYETWASLQLGHGIPPWNALSVLFFGGASSTLWFLPAALYSALVVSVLPNRRALLSLMGLAFAVEILMFSGLAPLPDHFFISRFPLGFICYVAGYLIGKSPGITQPRRGSVAGIVAVLLVLPSALAHAWALTAGGPTDLARYVGWASAHILSVVGVLILVWVASRSSGELTRLAPYAPLSMGVYLSHTLFAKVAVLVWPPSAIQPLLWVVAVFAIVLGASLVTTRLMSSTPLFSWAVGLGSRRSTQESP